jgi:proteasome lid subunit RPN8/RPN11
MDSRCQTQLRKSLTAVYPEEGCALLIGHILNEQQWVVDWIWPCLNVWQLNNDGIGAIFNSDSDQGFVVDKCTRFAVDSREQLAAQIWSRSQQLSVFGVAHSHPSGEAIPSVHDMNWGLVDSLLLIQSKEGDYRAWWLDNNRNTFEILISQSKQA